MTDAAAIREFLAGKTIAFAGLSTNPADFSRAVCDTLRKEGYRIIPVHPGVDEIADMKAFDRVGDIDEPIDGVLVMTPSTAAADVVRDAIASGVRRVWLHRGVGGGAVSDEAVALARDAGLTLVDGQCPLMFVGTPSFPHRAHAFFKKLAGTYPKETKTAAAKLA